MCRWRGLTSDDGRWRSAMDGSMNLGFSSVLPGWCCLVPAVPEAASARGLRWSFQAAMVPVRFYFQRIHPVPAHRLRTATGRTRYMRPLRAEIARGCTPSDKENRDAKTMLLAAKGLDLKYDTSLDRCQLGTGILER